MDLMLHVIKEQHKEALGEAEVRSTARRTTRSDASSARSRRNARKSARSRRSKASSRVSRSECGSSAVGSTARTGSTTLSVALKAGAHLSYTSAPPWEKACKDIQTVDGFVGEPRRNYGPEVTDLSMYAEPDPGKRSWAHLNNNSGQFVDAIPGGEEMEGGTGPDKRFPW